MTALHHNEPIIRLACFFAVLLAMMLWERRKPRRALSLPRARRWPANLGIIVVDSVVLRLVFPVLAVGAAELAAARGWGLFHGLNAPFWLALPASLLILDLAIYTQHVVFHKVAVLWRLHRMHHTDLDFDVTTALRFHPLEIVLSMLIKLVLVTLLGVPAVAVMLFEVILNATAMFNHGNVGLPRRLDRALRWILVTPDMHRVHHSIRPEETDSNFGFNLPWWDRLFGTYRDQPRDGHAGMTIGLEYFRDRRATRLYGLLLQPFLNPASGSTSAPTPSNLLP
ncbi:sterol desaturase family protein [Candidatus Competibacter phosphatis]|uniref:Sterol desaturase family protein n=1 Tax=Candidatus Competibacter phosphatis TaxID=221280 RepID=A0ABX1TNQ9_9GAMM|nr:sterol desaturase family protein [Candidatus Competibacter phosphatis]NMQ20194.1 sterol desaturase family protein [Candidatus Competibacter phosphatis]